MTDMLLYVLIALAAIQLVLLLQVLNAVRGRAGSPGAERMAALKLAEQARAVYAKAVTVPASLLGGGERQLRMATLWTAADVAGLKPGTPLLTSVCGDVVAETETALNWLLDQATTIRGKPAGQGQHFIDFPHEKWKANYEAAIDGLHLLETFGEVTAKVAAG